MRFHGFNSTPGASSPSAYSRILQVAVMLLLASALWSCDSRERTSSTSPAVDEVVEPGTPAEPSQEELAATFSTLSGLVAEARTEDVWRRFGVKRASVSVVENRLMVNATGDDAALILPPFAAGKAFMLQVILNSPVDTRAQLFHLVKGQTKYRDGQSQIAPLKAGRNVIYFSVNAPDVIDPLRFDPSAAPGEYTIERMTAMALP